MGAIISFLGGSVFRAVWGEVSTWLNNRQAHAQEMERIKLQSEIDVARSAAQLEAVKAQAALQIQTVQVQSEAGIRTYDKRADGSVHVPDRDARILRAEGLAVPASVAGATAHLRGFICVCGRRNYFRRCGACGETC